jgi:FMN-dependent oxidoreductase (nitrilotriacetate monooxygenase family)
VTSQNENEAQNFGLTKHVDHALRYERALEFFDVVAGLWDSWDDGAIIRDKETGTYFDITKLHFLNHEGPHFRVRGPLNVDRPPQGYPVIFQAGSSGPGRDLAAKTADAVFTAQRNVTDAQAFYEDVKSRAQAHGRRRDDIKILPGLTPIIGRTEGEAQELNECMRDLIPEDQAIAALMQISGGLDLRDFPADGPLPDLPPTNSAKGRQDMISELARRENLTLAQVARRWAESSGHLTLVGTPVSIAEEMQAWLEAEACDGFAIIHAYYPGGGENFCRLVVPELQKRGIFRTEYEGDTLRENLGLRKRGRGQ